MGVNFDASWALIAANVTAIVSAAQGRIARQADGYIPAVLEDTGQVSAIPTEYKMNHDAFVGVTGAGVSVDEAMYASVIVSKIAVGNGVPASLALKQGGHRLTQTAGTIMSDTGRGAERVAMAFRPIGGYARMLTPPSCSRCALLAGKRYQSDVAFQRHPGCDCRHIPASESVADDLVVNPDEYFDSLPTADDLAEKYPDLTVKMRNEMGIYSQEDVFTKAGAEAIRNGADVSQVVNARKGMYSSGGMSFTREGTTKRGVYGSRTRGQFYKVEGHRYSFAKRRRLMPEQIQKMTGSKAEYLRLLKTYGYIL